MSAIESKRQRGAGYLALLSPKRLVKLVNLNTSHSLVVGTEASSAEYKH